MKEIDALKVRLDERDETIQELQGSVDHLTVRATLHPDALAALELSIARTRVLDCLSPHLYS